LRELQLHGAVVQIQKRNSRLARQAYRSCADMNFAARLFVGPQIVTSGQRAIDISFKPILFAARLKRNRALHVVQSRNARRSIDYLGLRLRGILILRCCVLRRHQNQAGDERQEQCERELFGHELDPFVVGTGAGIVILRNQLAARNHANQTTMRVSDMADRDLHVRNPIMSF
jgi:hypothetical protein